MFAIGGYWYLYEVAVMEVKEMLPEPTTMELTAVLLKSNQAKVELTIINEIADKEARLASSTLIFFGGKFIEAHFLSLGVKMATGCP